MKSRKENEQMKKVFSMKTVDNLQSKLDELDSAMKVDFYLDLNSNKEKLNKL